MWPFNYLENRRVTILEQAGMGVVDLDAELGRLLRELRGNKNIYQLSQQPGWLELDEKLSTKAVRMIPELIQAAREGKHERVLALATWIEAINDLLGLVNRSLYESQLCRDLIDSRLTMKQRLEEKQNAE